MRNCYKIRGLSKLGPSNLPKGRANSACLLILGTVKIYLAGETGYGGLALFGSQRFAANANCV